MKTKNSNTVTTIREYVCKHSNDSQKPTTASVVCFTPWDSRSFTLMDFKSRVNGTLELKVTQGNKVIHFLALIKFSTNPPSLEKKNHKNHMYSVPPKCFNKL